MKKLLISEKVLLAVCELSNNIHGIDVVQTSSIMRFTGLSKYMVFKQLHFWRDKGFIERASMGCPAQVSCGEVVELICDAAPSVNGWKLTKKGRESNAFRLAQVSFQKSLAELVNGD